MGRISFQKRQKEMKRQEKQQMKAEKRAQRKLAKNAEATGGPEAMSENGFTEQEPGVPADSEPQPQD